MKSIMPANRSFYFSALRKWGCISVHVDGDGIHGMVYINILYAQMIFHSLYRFKSDPSIKKKKINK